MNTFRRTRILVPLVSALTMFALSVQAEEPNRGPPGRPGPAHAGPGPGRGPHDARFARGALPARNFGGHAYHGHLAWEGGHWRHEMHNGRLGWWWDVGGAWYFYPQPMEGPPTFVSDVEVLDDSAGPDGPPPTASDYPPPPPAGYAPPPAGYAPPPAAYAPPPPPPAPPPPNPAASAVGGAIVGGVLGGLISRRPVGVAAGAIAGGAAGAIVGAQAASRPGYYIAQGGCYYRYPSGQYVPVDPGNCN
jgi:hypothetical protein